MITIQGPPGSGSEWRCRCPETWNGKWKFRAVVYERGKTATTIHVHILIHFVGQRCSRKLAADLIRLNPGSEIDVQIKRGSWEQAIGYITKQDETKIEGMPPVIEGDRPKDRTSKEERKEEAETVVEIIKERGIKGVLEEDAESLLKFPNGCKLINEIVGRRSEKRTVHSIIIWGDAGTGKTTWANYIGERKWGKGEIYNFTKVGGCKETLWFNGYRGERCLIMDDISGRTMPFEYMLKITGNDPLTIEKKGGSEEAMWESVIITSNYDPYTWYGKVWEENEESRNAFFRRIATIIHVSRNAEGTVVWETQKDDKVQKMKKDFIIQPNWKKEPTWLLEEERCIREREIMAINDANTLDWNRAEKEDWNEETERSEIGVGEQRVEDDEINDTPGSSIYWGGEDIALTADNCSHEEWERNWEKKEALDRYFEVLKRCGAVKTRGELLEKIVHGEIPYVERDWVGELKDLRGREEREREEAIREAEAAERNHGGEELERDWERWIWEQLRPEKTPGESNDLMTMREIIKKMKMMCKELCEEEKKEGE